MPSGAMTVDVFQQGPIHPLAPSPAGRPSAGWLKQGQTPHADLKLLGQGRMVLPANRRMRGTIFIPQREQVANDFL